MKIEIENECYYNASHKISLKAETGEDGKEVFDIIVIKIETSEGNAEAAISLVDLKTSLRKIAR